MNWAAYLGAVTLCGLTVDTLQIRAGDLSKPASERFADPATSEKPDFQKHVLPLMGKLGCNGRACHGSFQGQGGFRLSLFGYDFQADHDALLKGVKPRVDIKNPDDSKLLEKPTEAVPHKGGKRFEVDSWQHRLLLRWIQSGAVGTTEHANLNKLEVTPKEIVFAKPGDTVQLMAIVHWANGQTEDVTCLCRFQTNDESIAEINRDGVVTCKTKGDTHVVTFYDNGVEPIPVMLPVSDSNGDKYPAVATPTRIDELVVAKLRKVGIVPSELCTDSEFLRRVSLDMTGTLPSTEEVKKFLADRSQEKRRRKIDELLERPAYAAWWTTKLCDITGNNSKYLDQTFRNEQAQQWYDWIFKRVKQNLAYDKIVEGIVLAAGRTPGESYDQYVREMTSYCARGSKADFADRESMPHFWGRRNLAKPEEKALNFSYAFLGVRLQCAQCHKHPFDQWTQQDFNQFTAFFNRVAFGLAPDARKQAAKIEQEAGLKGLKGNEQRKLMAELAKDGKPLPWREVFLVPTQGPSGKVVAKGKQNKVVPKRTITPKLLGGEEVVDSTFKDPRQPLMDWMRDPENPYFARSFTNRVWASYFSCGIIEPADDQNLANPPSNAPLLDYLAKSFIEHNFDLKWLHREIANSRTYQTSWKPNKTNETDSKNFSHSIVRRIPAEAVIDAIVMATSGNAECLQMNVNVVDRAIAQNGGVGKGKYKSANYALNAFGKPMRDTTCDCERSNDPSLLQSVFLRNDQDTLSLIDRKGGWLSQVGEELKLPFQSASVNPANIGKQTKNKPNKEGKAAGTADGKAPPTREQIAQQIQRVERQLRQVRTTDDFEQATKLDRRLSDLRRQLAKTDNVAKTPKPQPKATPADATRFVREIYLRTVGRFPSDDEISTARKHLAKADSPVNGLRDLLWAMLNTKEFVLNH